MKIHIVQKGDTLWKLAKKYGVSFEELKKVNAQLSNPDMMMPGMKIKIPGTSGAVIKEMNKPNINMGVKESQIQQPTPMKEQMMQKPPVKEQPKYQPPIKEQPKYQPPIKEQPKYQPPIKEQPKYQPPIKEQPKYQPPIKEQPKYQPPIKEQPKYQQPIKEQPKYQPKPIVKEKQIDVPKEVPVPTPVIPEIDINNYYMVNMANMSVQKPPAPPPLPKKKEEPIVSKKKKKKPAVSPEQEYYEPVDDCVPMTPIMPGTGYSMQPPPWAHMPMHGMQAPYQGGYAYPEPQGYQMMDESSENWGASPYAPSMGQGFVQGASMNPYSQQQQYPYQAPAPMPHHFYGGMMQNPQVAGSYMQQNHESPSESSSSYNHHNYPQQHIQSADEDEEDCGCNKGLLGTYGPEVKGQYQAEATKQHHHHHPDYHQYQSDESQQHYQDQNFGAYPQMGNQMQYHQNETESTESDSSQQYDAFMIHGQNGGQPGMMMGGQNGGQPGMMMGGQNGGQPGMMMHGQNGGQP
ncbi:SafA/ExsA family spore coat assembly protein, partial [Peribacillus muralis]|uniref:SafA/ExsA family spore coat assembly protein n=1 Tax=Peribacillus muralis TaxID=264697 RepID=UPI00128F5C29